MLPVPHAPTNPLALVLAALLVLGVILGGGGTHQSTQAMAFAGMGLLMIFAPVQRFPNKWIMLSSLALLGLAGTGLMPGQWFAPQGWRASFSPVGIVLPKSLSPQPAITLECIGLLFGGIAWMLWLVAQEWNPILRERAMKVLAGGMVCIAAFAIFAWMTGLKVPGWLMTEREFGPFPNRNHTGHVLALGGLLALGCAGNAMRWSWPLGVPWVVGASVIVVALVINYSRGGIVLFFGAVGLWAALAAWRNKSWKLLGLGVSGMLATAAMILLKGGATTQRFVGHADSDLGFRVKIWRDALELCSASPWTGIGLGNFKDVFPFFRKISLTSYGVWHPESDWLQVASEMGWFAVLLILVIIALLVRRVFPFRPGTQRRLRGAAFAAAIGAALHGLVDVPGHRLGCIMLALFALSLSRRDPARGEKMFLATLASRATGAVLIALAIWWMKTPNDSALAQELVLKGEYPEAIQAATRALQRAPMDWTAYYNRAQAAAVQGETLAAVGDFRRARVLEPNHLRLPMQEGAFWITREESLAFPAWNEALKRASEWESLELFSQIMGTVNTPEFREKVLELTDGKPQLALLWLQNAPVVESSVRLPRFERDAATWNRLQREALQKRAAEITELSPVKPAFR